MSADRETRLRAGAGNEMGREEEKWLVGHQSA